MVRVSMVPPSNLREIRERAEGLRRLEDRRRVTDPWLDLGLVEPIVDKGDGLRCGV